MALTSEMNGSRSSAIAEQNELQASDASSTSSIEPCALTSGSGSGSGSVTELGDRRGLVMIAWDIENVGMPLTRSPKLTPLDVVRHLKSNYIRKHQRTEYRTVAAITKRSLDRILVDNFKFVDEVIQDLTLMLADDAAVVLEQELRHYMKEHAATARANPGQLMIVLITSNVRFMRTVQDARDAGFFVEVLHHEPWSKFLRTSSGVQDIVLSYGDEHLHDALTPRSFLVAGYSGELTGGTVRAEVANKLVSSGAAVDVNLVVIEPTFGVCAHSFCAMVTPMTNYDVTALVRALRINLPDGVAVFEARQMLRLTLEMRPWQAGSSGVSGAAASCSSADDAAGAAAAARLFLARARLSEFLAAFRVAGGGWQALYVLCSFSSGPSLEEPACTLICGSASEEVDVVGLRPLIQAEAQDLSTRFGVVLKVECMFAQLGDPFQQRLPTAGAGEGGKNRKGRNFWKNRKKRNRNKVAPSS